MTWLPKVSKDISESPNQNHGSTIQESTDEREATSIEHQQHAVCSHNRASNGSEREATSIEHQHALIDGLSTHGTTCNMHAVITVIVSVM
jgi:hypothetical protein